MERLIDAIGRSIGPTGTQDFSREALILAYISQLFSSKGTILKVETKYSTIAQFTHVVGRAKAPLYHNFWLSSQNSQYTIQSSQFTIIIPLQLFESLFEEVAEIGYRVGNSYSTLVIGPFYLRNNLYGLFGVEAVSIIGERSRY